jgi:hypothetical protein
VATYAATAFITADLIKSDTNNASANDDGLQIGLIVMPGSSAITPNLPNIYVDTTASNNSEWNITLDEFDTGRAAYEKAVRGIKDQAYKMIEDGSSPAEAAEWAYNQRRALGVQYKNLTPPDLRNEIYSRNIDKYCDPLGPPNIDYYLEKGKTYEEIIESAAKPGGEDIIPLLRDRIIKRVR